MMTRKIRLYNEDRDKIEKNMPVTSPLLTTLIYSTNICVSSAISACLSDNK